MWPRLGSKSIRTAVFLAGAVVTSVFFINFCNLVYQCGCESLWAGADAHCNIHDPASRHCPWCAIGSLGQAGVYGAMVASQAAVAFGWKSLSVGPRLMLTLAAFPTVGGVLAVVIGVAKGYWS